MIFTVSATVILSGCHPAATFEAEAALMPGAVYSGPAVETFAQPVATLTVGEISTELLAMVEANHALAGVTELNPEPSQASQLRTIETAHTERLARILDIIGWPTERLVGRDAALASFVIAQQATHDPGFQKRCLSLMHDRLAAGEIDPQRVALLTDRVRIHAGLGQLYGTQIRLARNEHNVLVASPTARIADRVSLDDRRELLGLDPWRHYCRKVADTAERAQSPRIDLGR